MSSDHRGLPKGRQPRKRLLLCVIASGWYDAKAQSAAASLCEWAHVGGSDSAKKGPARNSTASQAMLFI